MHDPKKRAGDAKAPLHLFPTEPLRAASVVLKLGADKYGEYNWRETTVQAMTYVAAMRRHLSQFVDGEDRDGESGESHLAHIIATCAILLDAMRVGALEDNRPTLRRAAELRRKRHELKGSEAAPAGRTAEQERVAGATREELSTAQGLVPGLTFDIEAEVERRTAVLGPGH